jgi:hypothetical protein
VRASASCKEGRTFLWRCDVCGSPVRNHAGPVEIRNNRTGDWRHYDPDATEDSPDILGEVETQVNDALLALADPGVPFVACCNSCVTTGPSSGPVIALNSVGDMQSWCVWADHLGNKDWMRKRDVIRMIRFWWLRHVEEVRLFCKRQDSRAPILRKLEEMVTNKAYRRSHFMACEEANVRHTFDAYCPRTGHSS